MYVKYADIQTKTKKLTCPNCKIPLVPVVEEDVIDDITIHEIVDYECLECGFSQYDNEYD